MNTLSVVVTTPPASPLTATALDYIHQAINSNIKIMGVFFYQDGVLNASKQLVIPNDEFQINNEWKLLNRRNDISLHVCISACEKRGLTEEVLENNTKMSTIHDYFTISGLGELVELTSKSERVVQF